MRVSSVVGSGPESVLASSHLRNLRNLWMSRTESRTPTHPQIHADYKDEKIDSPGL